MSAHGHHSAEQHAPDRDRELQVRPPKGKARRQVVKSRQQHRRSHGQAADEYEESKPGKIARFVLPALQKQYEAPEHGRNAEGRRQRKVESRHKPQQQSCQNPIAPGTLGRRRTLIAARQIRRLW